MGNMSETEEPQRGAGASDGFLAAIAQFDWLKIPGAVRAISHIVTGVGDAGAAWLDVAQAKGEQRAQKIRDRTAARKSIMAATAKAAGVRAARNPALLDRMLQRFLTEELKHQENREAIAIEAGKLLEESPPNANTTGPSEDWLNVFSSYAEKATSERLRQHWAQILAGEIRGPGTFSLATLQMFSILDSALAADMETARRWIADDEWIPLFADLNRSPNYDVLLRLDTVGFLRRQSSRMIKRGAGESCAILFQNHAIVLSFKEAKILQIPSVLLTVQGKEALKIIAPSEDIDAIRKLALEMKKFGPDHVRIGKIAARASGQVEIEEEQDV